MTVLGFGRSGSAAALLAQARGAALITIQDKRDAVDLDEDKVLEVAQHGFRLELGGHKLDTLLASDLIVVSPGVPPLAQIASAEARGIPVVSEVELASWFVQAPCLAVTGTNGKSTVTALAGAMLAASGRPTFTGGNLGVPLSEVIGTPATRADGVLVLELSSYQLERTHTLRPRVAVLLNLTPDHLDRYPTMAEYGAAKQRVFMNQRGDDHAVVPALDAVVASVARAGSARVHTWGMREGDVRVVGTSIVDEAGETFALDQLKIRGNHNVENAMAALVAARLMGGTSVGMRKALGEFTGLPHRMQFVAEVNGVAYLDDSKATNVGAAVKALEGCDRPVVLVAGGRHKGGSYEPMRELLKAKGRAMVLIGEAREIMQRELGDVVQTQTAAGLAEAVQAAAKLAQNGDVVLLAPACSSLDMFADYEARGRAFADAVRLL